MATRFVLPFADVGSGILPSSGAQLFFYDNKTTLDKDTFTTATDNIANTNPVISDAFARMRFASSSSFIPIWYNAFIFVWYRDPGI